MKMAGFFCGSIRGIHGFLPKIITELQRNGKLQKDKKKLIPNDDEISNAALQIEYELQHD